MKVIIGLIGGCMVLWMMIREWMYHRLVFRHHYLSLRHEEMEHDLSHHRQEVTSLREANSYLQTLLKDHMALSSSSRQEIEKNIQGACTQAMIHTQNDFLSRLEPVLSHFQHVTQGNLKEQSSFFHSVLDPLKRNLHDMTQHIHTLEQARMGAYESLKEQLIHLSQGQKALYTETNSLMMALRAPHVRGSWGEMQLRRVVELAGMTAYCDFQEQMPLKTEGSHPIRPDLVIRLPGGKSIIVDAKVPLLHYLEALSVKTSAEYSQKMKDHSRLLSQHIKILSEKKYWKYLNSSIDFTILFLPGEPFLSAALESDPLLMEVAAERQIILATPIILIALLKTIAYGWRQDRLSQHTQRILSLSEDLTARFVKFQDHMQTLGKALKQSHKTYHDAMVTLEDHLIPSAQKLSYMDSQESESIPCEI